MIKLINCDRRLAEPQVVYISKENIGGMMRRETDGVMYTEVYTKEERPYTYFLKETPEEILAMPDIEEGNKIIDWEQRRYEIAKHILSQTFIGSPKVSARNAVWYADALIEELKGGKE